MFKLKQKTKTASLSLALAAAMTGGVMMGTSTSVQAVNIAQDGVGEVLIFPYYTVREGWQSYFNITNTSDRTVVAKVRWREGANSREARDFNIVLSPRDVWTAAIVPTDEGARVITSDNTCTAPALLPPAGLKNPPGRSGTNGVDFTNLAFTDFKGEDNSDTTDPTLRTLDRTREGYFTVFASGVAINEDVQTAIDAKHESNGLGENEGVPFDCRNIRKRMKDEIFDLKAEFGEPENLLKGRAVLIRADKGVAMGYDPVVLANFYNPDVLSGHTDGFDSNDDIIEPPASDKPNLNTATPILASWIDDTPGVGLLPIIRGTASGAQSDFLFGPATASSGIVSRGADAVTALFMHTAVINDYNVATGSETDWVLSFPTKRYYVDEDASRHAALVPGAGAPIDPFDRDVSGERFSSLFDGKSCFDVTVTKWDREEFTSINEGTLQFSPPEPGAPGDKLCYETNVISFGESNVLKSILRKSFTALPAKNGWAEIGFNGQRLPVIGTRFEFRKRDSVDLNLGFANAHAYKR